MVDLFTAGNGALPMLSLIEDRTTEKDWFRYMVAATQLVLFSYHAITSCQTENMSLSTTSNGIEVEVLIRAVTLLTNFLGGVLAFFDGSFYLFGWNLTSLISGAVF
jgi:hypothetical protein